MNDRETQQRWVELYQLALLEFDQRRMAARLLDARNEIFLRLEVLIHLPGSHEVEQQDIQDALRSIRSLRKEQQEWFARQDRVAG